MPTGSCICPEAAAGRNPGIDTLRGVAILMVMLLHFDLTYDISDHGRLAMLIGPGWASALLDWGNYGVTAFFVVSGYLITSQAAARAGGLGRLDLRAFYARRVARLAPCLLLALGIVVPLGLAGVPSFRADTPHAAAALLLGALSVLGCCHNILMQSLGYFDYVLNVYWSLSVEEVFYAGFPLACRALRRDWLVAVPCLALVGIGPAYRAAHADNDIYYLYANLACFDAIAIGCLTALLARRWRPRGWWAVVLQVAGWAAMAAVWVHGFGGQNKVWGFTALALTAAAIVLGSVGRKRAVGNRSTALLRWLGRHSYELYLFHIIVLAGLRNVVPAAGLSTAWQPAVLLGFLAASAAAAHAAAVLVGAPAARWLRRDRPAAA